MAYNRVMLRATPAITSTACADRRPIAYRVYTAQRRSAPKRIWSAALLTPDVRRRALSAPLTRFTRATTRPRIDQTDGISRHGRQLDPVHTDCPGLQDLWRWVQAAQPGEVLHERAQGRGGATDQRQHCLGTSRSGLDERWKLIDARRARGRRPGDTAAADSAHAHGALAPPLWVMGQIGAHLRDRVERARSARAAQAPGRAATERPALVGRIAPRRPRSAPSG